MGIMATFGLKGGAASSRSRIASSAAEALRGSDLTGVLELIGTQNGDMAASEALLKELLAEKVADTALRAVDEARKRNSRVGAAALIIAAGCRR